MGSCRCLQCNAARRKGSDVLQRIQATGVVDLVIAYLIQQKITTPIIIDVGCSTGIAIKTAVDIMQTRGFSPHTIGIDAGKWPKSKAEKNLDEFINEDVLNVSDKNNSANIVICSKAAIYVTGPRREAIIRKCASFLKEDGVLITDVDCFPPRSLKENTLRMLRTLWYQMPTLDCFIHGIKNIEREYEKRSNTAIRRDVFKLDKPDVILYTDEIIRGWKKRSTLWQRWWKFRIFAMLGFTTK